MSSKNNHEVVKVVPAIYGLIIHYASLCIECVNLKELSEVAELEPEYLWQKLLEWKSDKSKTCAIQKGDEIEEIKIEIGEDAPMPDVPVENIFIPAAFAFYFYDGILKGIRSGLEVILG